MLLVELLSVRGSLEGRTSYAVHVLTVRKHVTEQTVPAPILSQISRKIKRVVRSSLAVETSSMANVHGTIGLDENIVEPGDDDRVFFGRLRGCFETQTTLSVTDCKSLYDASHKEGASPSSTNSRLATDLAIVKSRATESEADLSWIDVRYQIADCLIEHASRRSEEVLQREINQAQWRITAEDTMLETRREERGRERPRRFCQEASEGGS